MRRTKVVTITTEGRDKGKSFLLTEMAAAQAEEWALRAIFLLAKSGVDVGASAGVAGLAAAGFSALAQIDYKDVKPLLDEMWVCVQYQHKPENPPQALVEGVNAQIQEVTTRLQLRKEVFALHVDF